MKVVSSLNDLWTERTNLAKPIGLVPTMGFLHDGHLSLVRRSIRDCTSTVVSIFVNPTQFGPQEDLTTYPRDLPRDLKMLKEIGVNLVWVPELGDMYPPSYQTWITLDEVTKPLEGSMRPGHFRGVATVVAKLFNAVQPQKAFFGQKDAQQAVVIRRMVKDLNYPIQVVICPIRREPDGLAMSSRNVYLDPAERKAALCLSRALAAAREKYENGERNGDKLRQEMLRVLSAEPLANVQYVSCADQDDLHELDTVEDRALLSLAVYIGKTRLIDNTLLPQDPEA